MTDEKRTSGEVKQIQTQRRKTREPGRTQARQTQTGRGQVQQRRRTQAPGKSPEQMRKQAARRRQEKRAHMLWWTAQSAIICLILLLFFGIIVRVRHIEKEIAFAGASPEVPLTSIIPATGENADLAEGEDDQEELEIREELGNIPEYARECELEEVGKPTKLEGEKLWNELQRLAEDDSRISAIIENSGMYPEELLVNLASNPEMADFVSNYPGEFTEKEAELTKEEKQMEYPLFLQWDPRWGYQSYGESNIAIAGCGPTSLAMALFALTRDETMTPGMLAEYAMQNGYYMYGTGTKWALMEEVPVNYGVNSRMLDTDELGMKQALDNGEILICSVRQGDFTAGGHFIMIYGYDDTGFLVNDPNCVARSRETWDFKQLKHQLKQIWALSK